jgi:Ni/Fe-hydrogenase b-type cytochrome subunit
MATDATSRAGGTDAATLPQGGDLVRRHRLSTRIWHWINAFTLLILLGSGLMIFNAHPMLYWGKFGANPDPSWLQIGHSEGEGYLRVGGTTVQTTGVLGVSAGPDGQLHNVAFPGWATIPSTYNLALARLWHLTFAWVLAIGLASYGLWSLINGHVRRDLLPTAEEVRPSHVWADIKHHATLNFPKGAAALKYNILQKAAYLGVLGILIPAMILTGMTMSPALNATFPWMLDLFGGRQSARSIHFIAAGLLVGFLIVHLIMVVLAGPFNEIRSMITGWFRLPKEKT